MQDAPPVAPTTLPAPAGPLAIAPVLRVTGDCSPVQGGDVVVCGRHDDEKYRVRPLPPPPADPGLITKPLRLKIAPGVAFGLLPGGGIGFTAKFGPGKKDHEGAAASTDGTGR